MPSHDARRFVSLPDSVRRLIARLNRAGCPATLDSIRVALAADEPNRELPRKDVLFGVLCALVAEGALYCTGENYFVVTTAAAQAMYRQTYNPDTADAAPYYCPPQSTAAEKCTRECQTGASVVDTPIVFRPKTGTTATSSGNGAETQTKTKGFFARLFTKRGEKSRERSKDPKSQEKSSESRPVSEPQSAVPTATEHLGTFNAQFPPFGWMPQPVYHEINGQLLYGAVHKYKSQWKSRIPPAGVPMPDVVPQGRATDEPVIAARFSKCLSSSTESLHYLGTVDPPSLLPSYAQLHEAEYYDTLRHMKKMQRAKKKLTRRGRLTQELYVQRQVSPTTDHLLDKTAIYEPQYQQLAYDDTMLDSTVRAVVYRGTEVARTSTPTEEEQPRRNSAPFFAAASVPDDQGDTTSLFERHELACREDVEDRDSALSTNSAGSRGVRDESDEAGGGGCWSDEVQEEDDRTYMNVRHGPRNSTELPGHPGSSCKNIERTYMNMLTTMNTTRFEEITDLPTLTEIHSRPESGLDDSLDLYSECSVEKKPLTAYFTAV